MRDGTERQVRTTNPFRRATVVAASSLKSDEPEPPPVGEGVLPDVPEDVVLAVSPGMYLVVMHKQSLRRQLVTLQSHPHLTHTKRSMEQTFPIMPLSSAPATVITIVCSDSGLRPLRWKCRIGRPKSPKVATVPLSLPLIVI